MCLYDKPIVTKQDFLEFLSWYIQELKTHPQHWTNKDLPSYLEALNHWIDGMEQYYINTKQDVPADINWKVIYDMLMAARIYE